MHGMERGVWRSVAWSVAECGVIFEVNQLEDCARLVGSVDADGDGVIDFKEFEAICRDGI